MKSRYPLDSRELASIIAARKLRAEEIEVFLQWHLRATPEVLERRHQRWREDFLRRMALPPQVRLVGIVSDLLRVREEFPSGDSPEEMDDDLETTGRLQEILELALLGDFEAAFRAAETANQEIPWFDSLDPTTELWSDIEINDNNDNN